MLLLLFSGGVAQEATSEGPSRLISLGIGSPASIAGFVLVGLFGRAVVVLPVPTVTFVASWTPAVTMTASRMTVVEMRGSTR